MHSITENRGCKFQCKLYLWRNKMKFLKLLKNTFQSTEHANILWVGKNSKDFKIQWFYQNKSIQMYQFQLIFRCKMRLTKRTLQPRSEGIWWNSDNHHENSRLATGTNFIFLHVHYYYHYYYYQYKMQKCSK